MEGVPCGPNQTMRAMLTYQPRRPYICDAFAAIPCMVEEPPAKYGQKFQNGIDIKKAPWENSEGASANSETATMQRTTDGFGNKATVISEDDRTKVNINLDIAKSVYGKRTNNTKGFITDIARALGLKRYGSSQYGTFITPGGRVFTLRVSNHNAKVNNFDKNDEAEGISVVVSNYANTGLKNDGKAHVTEFFYRRADINRSKGKPLVEILYALQKMLQTGEYVDTTGLAYVEEVNGG